jgi:hypothetical protein
VAAPRFAVGSWQERLSVGCFRILLFAFLHLADRNDRRSLIAEPPLLFHQRLVLKRHDAGTGRYHQQKEERPKHCHRALGTCQSLRRPNSALARLRLPRLGTGLAYLNGEA